MRVMNLKAAVQSCPARRSRNSGLRRAILRARFPAMDTRIADDARFALLAKVRQARRMSARAKLLAGFELFEEACAWSLAGIAAQNPGASESEKRRELRRRLELADRLNR